VLSPAPRVVCAGCVLRSGLYGLSPVIWLGLYSPKQCRRESSVLSDGDREDSCYTAAGVSRSY
jgi:hypothetical protein